MATDGNRATTARALKVPRLPGDIMIYPMIAGLLINTFCPQVLEIGGFCAGSAMLSVRFAPAVLIAVAGFVVLVVAGLMPVLRMIRTAPVRFLNE